MQKLKILNSKEIKRLKQLLEKQFSHSFQEDYAYLENENKHKIYIVTKNIANIELEKLRIDRYGIYLGELKWDQFRLSLEASQLLYKDAKENNVELSNVLELTELELREYFKGMDLEKPELSKESKLVLLKYKDDVFGCAKLKFGTLINFMPKIHRGEVIV
ncbi:hypothetical protein HN385_03880 [archaeon]|jgi:NOL1/NOP2/fmu family ribosome biogenesis protein|nr:hypothetical protein [archaeon]MBT3450888.1 hypothetical protein [archaeon]MBT6869070.1 hypothetical protein [archaeon]MBT7193313.1 hypothetical protein [archaeon]MBT7380321.1 hypothetical protein [archaeon]